MISYRERLYYWRILNMIPTIDLFAGAGGIGIGAHLAGGELLLSVEIDKMCCKTLRQNSDAHPGRVLESDIDCISGQELRELTGLSSKDLLVIVGGPTCQPFSKASYCTDPGDELRYRQARSQGIEVEKPAPITQARIDERRDLVDTFLNRIIEANADGFVLENVESILHPRNKKVVEDFILKAEYNGYKCNLIRANAVDYGVPQIRQRVFILAARSQRPAAPEPTHFYQKTHEKPHGYQPTYIPDYLQAYVSAKKALEGLDADEYFEPEEVVKGKWESEFMEIPPGMNYKALSAWAGHPNPVFIAETRFWNFLLKLSPNKPSWTIAATLGQWTGPFHWNNRRLRTVEMAALQTFPSSYVFAGSRREKVRQIGNAAPPQLVKCMVEKVYEAVQ